jgi:nitrite reductase/ring-hydroxylating ferredoxin subunit
MAEASLPSHPTLASSAVAEAQSVVIETQGQTILVCRSGGQLYAVLNRCPHASSRLEGGRLHDGVITCPLHGAKFRLSTGECLFRSLNYPALQTFAVSEVDGKIEVTV